MIRCHTTMNTNRSLHIMYFLLTEPLPPKQQECIQRLFEQVQERFPEIEFLSLQRNRED